MKRYFLGALMMVFLSASLYAKGNLKISSTIGPVDAGIIPLLAQTFTQKSGIEVTYEKAGTGKTLEKAKSGDFDLVIVHARALEEKFIADGYGIDRRDIMYNDFVILGPKDDPAGIKGLSASEAFKKIASQKAKMISRADRSGTHIKEMDIWKKAEIEPDGQWYEKWKDGDKGNGPTTIYADSQSAYVLMDRATYLIKKPEIKIVPLVEGDEILLNFIASIRINPERFPNVNKQAAIDFVDFMVSKEGQDIIKTFKVKEYGEPLFFPNAK